MTKANTQVIAKAAAIIAGAGLVLSSFALAIPADAQTTTTTTTTTSSAMFTRDLTIGSTGADVTALQTWLIGKGFSIPAGATGYFGMQTKAAVAAYQAANGITPAAGYFGPITRAKVNAGGSVSTGGSTVPGCMPGAMFSSTTGASCSGGSTGGSTSGALSGGEADLNNFDLRSGDGSGDEGEQGVELANAKFDVDGGDARIERVELTASSTGSSSLEDKPWKYFDTITVMGDGKELGEVDASDRENWDEGDDNVYTISISELSSYIVREGDAADISFVADINDSIDTANQAQKFNLSVMENGIRAVDSDGIQQYTGDDSDTVSFGFGAQDNGDLSIRSNKDNPDGRVLKVDDSDTSDAYDVFSFEVRNSSDADAIITDLVINTTSTGATSTDKIIRTATLSVDGDDFDGDIQNANDGTITFDNIDVPVDGNDTVVFTLSVEFAAQTGTSYANGDVISFTVNSANVDAEGAESGDTLSGSDFTGSASSDDFTLSTTGFNVEAVSADSSADNKDTGSNSTGTFTIKFDVTADEDDPIYIDDTASNATTTSGTPNNGTAGAVYQIMRNGATSSLAAFTSENAVLTSTATKEGGTFRVDAGETETFTLTVTIDPAVSGLYAAELNSVNYGSSPSNASNASNNSTFVVDPDDADFETDPVNVQA